MFQKTIWFAFAWLALSSMTSTVAQEASLQKTIANSNANVGKRYALRCKACHTLNKGGANRLGPNLWGIVGRKQASTKGVKYSKAFKGLKSNWSLTELDKFLANPRKYAPGNRMAFAGVRKASQRYGLIAYLATLTDAPPSTAKAKQSTRIAARPDGPSLADELKLPNGSGRETVAAICSACHSLKIVQQQGLDKSRWDELMDWMTEKQGMPALSNPDRKKVVNYLASNYGPQSRSRRINPMSPMMPRMPLPKSPK